MKSISFLFLSFLLVSAILAPSLLTLFDIDSKTELVMDFNEDENKKEGKKEKKEKEFIPSFSLDGLSDLNGDFSKFSSYYLEVNYSFSTTIVSPPPEQLS